MKEFKIIKNEYNAVENAGYKRDDAAPVERDFAGVYENLGYYERERRMDAAEDAFFEGDAVLGEGEDGNLYAIYTAWNGEKMVPVIWQRVKEA